MKSSILVFLVLLCFGVEAQNRKPKIVGQVELSTNEDQRIRILMADLTVEDRDDWFYPWGFTMTLYPGPNYTLDGDFVTPAPDFSGLLVVEVTVNDGDDNSNKYKLQITVIPVNDRPVITGNSSLSVDEGTSVSLNLSDLKVSDPDNKYPDDFTMNVYPGSNYSVDGNSVTPSPGFTGTLSVNVTVRDGDLESDTYALAIQVRPVVRVPKITGQSPLVVNEDEPLTLKLTDLIVVDGDSEYPNGFTLAIEPGANYSVSNGTINPAKDFNGRLTVPVTVNDGTNKSEPFNLSITVVAVNDAPMITDLETNPRLFPASEGSVSITQTLSVTDVDGDSIVFAEVGIVNDGYQANVDKLVYAPPAGGKIRGVFDSGTGVLTLLGEASPSTYARAIRSVTFEGMPIPGQAKTIYFKVNDGKVDSETANRMIVSGDASVTLDIPSGFTPNGDQANDTWKIVPLTSDEEISGARVKVYNKAGKIVYEAIGFESEWDGRLNGEMLPADTYFYTIDLNLNSPSGYLKGLVTILR